MRSVLLFLILLFTVSAVYANDYCTTMIKLAPSSPEYMACNGTYILIGGDGKNTYFSNGLEVAKETWLYVKDNAPVIKSIEERVVELEAKVVEATEKIDKLGKAKIVVEEPIQ